MGTTGSQRVLTCSYRVVYIPLHPPEKENLKYFDKLLVLHYACNEALNVKDSENPTILITQVNE